jgi:hypothetical protein
MDLLDGAKEPFTILVPHERPSFMHLRGRQPIALDEKARLVRLFRERHRIIARLATEQHCAIYPGIPGPEFTGLRIHHHNIFNPIFLCTCGVGELCEVDLLRCRERLRLIWRLSLCGCGLSMQKDASRLLTWALQERSDQRGRIDAECCHNVDAADGGAA